MPSTTRSIDLLIIIGILLLFAPRVVAFGAGNIQSNAKIEGANFRHGDIEDTLLTLFTARAMGGKKFSKLDVKRVYFGNWLRDYSQAIDVGTVKYVSAEAIRLLLWILGFMSFGYGTGEFEVTKERLGCYRPEEHIDNPKDYADNIDAQQYDRRLRAPVDERRELAIDPRNGLKTYIASEDKGITTSAGLVRNLLGKCIDLGRRYKRTKNTSEYYEALRLMGTATHCLEDYSAHSNYVELALIELGERDVFPHVGRRTQLEVSGVRHPVYPIVTGTFGGVDFLHSVCGEFSDKAAQSELQQLQGALQQAQRSDTSVLKELLNKLPPGLLGGDDQPEKAEQLQANATAAGIENMRITPKDPEAFTQQLDEITRQIYPILQFHDEIMQNITETVDKIPVLPELIEEIQSQIQLFVFGLLSPIMTPVINQVKNELNAGSEEIIQSSKEKQLIVFRDDNSTNPTHSMLSKDHFSSVLNEPAGRIASSVLTWVVPQIVACWDDDNISIPQTLDRIINGVFHHPALRNSGNDGARDGRMLMFGVVEQWWAQMSDRERNDMRDKLSRDGVENGRNHKEGVHDTGHGCGKPLTIGNGKFGASGGALAGPASNVLGSINQALTGTNPAGRPSAASNAISSSVGNAVGGGALGSIVGGIAGGLLGDAFGGGSNADTTTYQSGGYGQDGSYTSRITETGHRPGGQGQQERYGQAQISETQYPGGGYREDVKRFEQDGHSGRTGYGFEQSTEVRRPQEGGYEQRTERRYEHPGGRYETEVQVHGVSSSGRPYGHEETRHGHKKNDSDDSNDDSDDDDDWEKKERKRKKKEEKRRRKQQEEESSRRHEDNSETYGRRQESSGYRQENTYEQSGGYDERRQEHGRQEGRQPQNEYGRNDFGSSGNDRHQRQEHGGDRSEQPGYGRGEYGQESRPEYGNQSFGRQEREDLNEGYGQRRERNDDQQYGYGRSRREDEY